MITKGGDVLTSEVRCAFPAVFKPEVNKTTGKEQYVITLLFPKNDPTLKELMDHAGRTVNAKFPVTPGQKQPKVSSPFKDSLKPTEDSGKIPAEDYGYGDCIAVRCTSQFAPGIVDASRAPLIDPKAIYGGCYVRCVLNTFMWQFEKTKNGVGVGLLHIQKTRDGEPFQKDRSVAASSVFEEAPEVVDTSEDAANYAKTPSWAN